MSSDSHDTAQGVVAAPAHRHASLSVAFCIESLSVGGAEQMLVVLANRFLARGWQVHMICLSSPGELADRLHDGVKLHVLHKRPGLDRRLPQRLRRLIRSIQPAVVNSHLWVANLWTRVSLLGLRIPVVITEHSRDTWKPRSYRFADRLLAARTYQLVAVSADTADFYINTIKVSRARVIVINNGVDTARYAAGRGETLRDEWLPTDGFLVGSVGRLIEAKNHHRLLDAAVLLRDRVPELRVVLVGDGPEKEHLQNAIQDRSLQGCVRLLGQRHDIPDVLAALDVFVLSSDREGHPLTALEAQAAGTPVVLTNAGGSADAIAGWPAGEACGARPDSTGGWLVERNAEALSDALQCLANDQSKRLAMARFGQEYALAEFDSEQMVDRYETLFRHAGG